MILGHTNKNVNNTFMIAKLLKIEQRVGCLEIYKKNSQFLSLSYFKLMIKLI